MNLRSTPIFLLLAVLAIGCKSGDNSSTATTDSGKTATTTSTDNAKPSSSSGGAGSLVGTWTSDDKAMNGIVTEFKADGTCSISGSIPGPSGKTVGMDGEATYKVVGDTLTLHPVSVKMTAPADADAKMKQQVDATNKAMASQKQQDQDEKINWIDKDSFTFTDLNGANKGKVITFKRKA